MGRKAMSGHVYLTSMATALIRLRGRTIADDGSVVVDHDTLLSMARDGKPLNECWSVSDPRTDRYNRISKTPIRIFEEGEESLPPPETHEWRTPEPWRSMDVVGEVLGLFYSMGFADDPRYEDRISYEIAEMSERGMLPLIAHVMWMIHDWKGRGVVYGVGRGSSCASLVLFVIGLHGVDPVRWEIPIEEFLR